MGWRDRFRLGKSTTRTLEHPAPRSAHVSGECYAERHVLERFPPVPLDNNAISWLEDDPGLDPETSTVLGGKLGHFLGGLFRR